MFPNMQHLEVVPNAKEQPVVGILRLARAWDVYDKANLGAYKIYPATLDFKHDRSSISNPQALKPGSPVSGLLQLRPRYLEGCSQR